VLVPNWWCVGLPALAVALAYVTSRFENWAADRRIERAHRELIASDAEEK
jgi:hypothetical protein